MLVARRMAERGRAMPRRGGRAGPGGGSGERISTKEADSKRTTPVVTVLAEKVKRGKKRTK